MSKRILFVINPISGDKNKDDLPGKIETFSDARNSVIRFYNTTGNNDKEAIGRLIDEFEPDIVGVAGGDGTINLLTPLLINTGILLGIFPQGSANGLAKDLLIPQNPDECLRIIHGDYSMDYDVVVINDEYYSLHLAEMGFNARVVKRYDEKDARGWKAYATSVIQEYFGKNDESYYRIKTPEDDYIGKAFMVSIANSRKYGTNVTINPNGNPGDGLFEIIIIKPFPKSELLINLTYLFQDKISMMPYVQVIQCSEAVVENIEHQITHIDGEVVTPIERMEVKIIKHALKILVPEKVDVD